LRLGLPIAAIFVAINPIWGFNTESWASGVYQKMTELRVNTWRVAMVDAVLKAVDGDLAGSLDVIDRIMPTVFQAKQETLSGDQLS
jgi:hypothetical protein